MKVIKITTNKDKSARMDYSITPTEYNLFKQQAKAQHKKFGTKFINSEILKALASYCKTQG
jgi:hypothetical protein